MSGINTCDIGAMDEDGFVSRSSKIGREMVPHIKVEDKLHEIAGATEQIFAATAVPECSESSFHSSLFHNLPHSALTGQKSCIPLVLGHNAVRPDRKR